MKWFDAMRPLVIIISVTVALSGCSKPEPLSYPYEWIKSDLPWATPTDGGWLLLDEPAGYAETHITASGQLQICTRNGNHQWDCVAAIRESKESK